MRVLVAGEHHLVRSGLKAVLDALESGVEVAECDSFPEALQLAAQGESFDLAIVDLHLPGMGKTVEAFLNRMPAAPVLVFSANYRRGDVLETLRAGAAGFFPMSLSRDGLMSAIRLVLAGERFVPAELLAEETGDPGGLVEAGAPYKAGNPLQQLSDREGQVLAMLLEGLPNKEIGQNLHIREVTVKLHLKNIYRKLGARNRAHAVRIAFDLGWRGGA